MKMKNRKKMINEKRQTREKKQQFNFIKERLNFNKMLAMCNFSWSIDNVLMNKNVLDRNMDI